MVSAPPSSPSPTPLGRLDASLINRAVHALLKHHSATSSQSTSLFEDELDVQVQLSLLRIPGNSSPKPIRIDIPHSFVKVGRDPDEDDGDTTMQDDDTAGASPPEICLIVKDSLKPALQALLSRFASQSDSSTTLSCIKKILTLTSLRQKHKTFARKRELLAKYDIFLADDRILPMLTKALGKGFFHKKKQPIPICLTRNVPSSSSSSSANETGLILRLDHILRATYLHLSSGTCLTVKAGTTSMSPSRLVENIAAIAEKAPSKVPRKWANVKSISIKTTNSVALPIYNKSPEEIEQLLYLARVEKREEGAANGEEEDHGDADGGDVDAVEQTMKKRKEKKEKRKELAESTPLGRALKKQKSLEKKQKKVKEGKDDTPVEMQDDRDVEDANVEEKEDKTPAESLENEEEKGTARKSKKERKEKKKATVDVVPPENTNQDDDEGDEPNEEKLPTEKPKSSKKKSKKNTKEEDKEENVEKRNDAKEKEAADSTEDMLPTETPKSSKKKSKKKTQAEGKDIQAMTQAEGKNVANDQQEEKTTESSAPTKTPKSSKKRKGTNASNDDATDPAVTPATSKNDDKQSTKKKTKELKESGPANASPASADAAFIPSKKFQGSKPGYVFRKDKKGLGYYKDVLPVVDKVWLKSLKNAGRGGGGGGGGGARGGKSKRGVSNTPAKRRKGGSRRSF
ncbi:hypothetical protein ACHAXS_012508 [Conticribra weissflogii]